MPATRRTWSVVKVSSQHLQQRARSPQQLLSSPQRPRTRLAGLLRCRPGCAYSLPWCRCAWRSYSTWRSGSSRGDLVEVLQTTHCETARLSSCSCTGNWWLTHIFIHVERLDILKGDFSILVILNQFLVTTQWSASYKENVFCSYGHIVPI